MRLSFNLREASSISGSTLPCIILQWSQRRLGYLQIPPPYWGPEPKSLSIRSMIDRSFRPLLLTFSSLSATTQKSANTLRGSVTVNIWQTFLGFPLLQNGSLWCPGSLGRSFNAFKQIPKINFMLFFSCSWWDRTATN